MKLWSWARVSMMAMVCMLSLHVASPEAHAASVKRYGYTDGTTTVLFYLRGKNIAQFSMSLPLTCADTSGEFTTTFTSSSFYGTGGLGRRSQLQATLVFEDGSGRNIVVVATGDFRSRNPIIRISGTPSSTDTEVCDPFLISVPLQKLRR